MEDVPEPGSLLGGKYRVVKELGSGAMGMVLEVRHELTEHHRAMKIIHPDALAHKDALERFLREASAAGRIGSPHIVDTFDAGMLDDGQPYLVMECLKGETLADRMDREGALPIAWVVDVFVQICDGLHAAHEAGIVHRDLKPENVFIEARAEGPFVKLLDFGILKYESALTNTTDTGVVVGTPGYMAPEQARGEKILDRRCDVYAAGVMLYECLAGEHPYPADSLPVMIAHILEARPDPIRTVRGDVPELLSEVVAQAMEKDRDRRVGSAAGMRALLVSVQDELAFSGAAEPRRPKAGGPAASVEPRIDSHASSEAVAAGSLQPSRRAETERTSKPRESSGRSVGFGAAVGAVAVAAIVGWWLVTSSNGETENTGTDASAERTDAVDAGTAAAEQGSASPRVQPAPDRDPDSDRDADPEQVADPVPAATDDPAKGPGPATTPKPPTAPAAPPPTAPPPAATDLATTDEFKP